MSWAALSTDWFILLRWLNALLSLVVFVGMCFRFRCWQAQPVLVRLYGLGLTGLVISSGYIEILLALEDAPVGPLTLVITIPLLWLNVATFWPTNNVKFNRTMRRLRQRLRGGRNQKT